MCAVLATVQEVESAADASEWAAQLRRLAGLGMWRKAGRSPCPPARSTPVDFGGEQGGGGPSFYSPFPGVTVPLIARGASRPHVVLREIPGGGPGGDEVFESGL